MLSSDYKSYLETEILSGMIFDEENYSVDAGEHFELAPNDVVKIDLRPAMQRLVGEMKAIRSATYGQVEIDDVTGEVSVNGNIVNAPASGGGSSGGGTSSSGEDTGGETGGDSDTNKIMEFLKMLKANGSLDKLKELDPVAKKKIAGEILKIINGNKRKVASKANPTTATPETTPPEDKTDLSKGTGLFEEEILLLKEAFIYANEEAPINLEKKPAPAATVTATPSPAPAPNNPTTPDPSMKMSDVLNDKNFQKDGKVSYYNNLKKKYDAIVAIPGAKNRELLAKVTGTNDKTNEVNVVLFKKTDTTPEGKANFKAEGEPVSIPQASVKKRMPVQQIKKKGLFDRFFG